MVHKHKRCMKLSSEACFSDVVVVRCVMLYVIFSCHILMSWLGALSFSCHLCYILMSWLGALCSSLIAAIQNQKVNHYLILFTAHLFTYSNRIKNKIKIKTNNYNNRNNLV